MRTLFPGLLSSCPQTCNPTALGTLPRLFQCCALTWKWRWQPGCVVCGGAGPGDVQDQITASCPAVMPLAEGQERGAQKRRAQLRGCITAALTPGTPVHPPWQPLLRVPHSPRGPPQPQWCLTAPLSAEVLIEPVALPRLSSERIRGSEIEKGESASAVAAGEHGAAQPLLFERSFSWQLHPIYNPFIVK